MLQFSSFFILLLLLMIIKINQIIVFALITMGISFVLYPWFIKFLRAKKVGQSIREADMTGKKSEIFNKLHKHKHGTPTMWGAIFLIIVIIMILISLLVQKMGLVRFSLWNREETYLLIFGFFSMGMIGVLDDYLNIKGFGAKKGLSARSKMLGMVVFSAFISWWFYAKLGIDYINFWPIVEQRHIGIFFPIVSFIMIIAITNAINIVDGLDGLAGGLMSMILLGLGMLAFFNQTFIISTLVAVLLSVLIVFMFFNIYPAKVFMGDSWALGLWGFLWTLLLMLNMKIGVFVPFLVLFLLFILDTGSSALQIFWKKVFKKKLFPVAPLHHLLENRWVHEANIVMKAWIIQLILLSVFIILMSLQILRPWFTLSS